MIRRCQECQRVNPAEASFCFYDGKPLANGSAAGEGASIDFSTWAFPSPFVFPSGARCHNFLQLALACKRNPRETVEVLQGGFFKSFFGSIGRIDLAMAMASLAAMTDPDRALDELLGKLPGSPLGPAELTVAPFEKNFGVLAIGQDSQFTLTLTNKGDRLLYGKVLVAECPWLVVGDGSAQEKVFQFFDKIAIPVRALGKRLRANDKPQKGEIAVESNGGNFIVPVEVVVPVKPFAQGVLSGASSPRQVAEKAKAHAREAALLLESGAVARWYESNGWDYPVQGPTASGLAAVQQFFEVLGLVKAPKVELSEPAITLRGEPGERLEYVLTVLTHEKRAAVAHATGHPPWLTVGKTIFRGQMASIPLIVEAVPDQPGQSLKAWAKVTANGNQRFDVPVSLLVGGAPARPRPVAPPSPALVEPPSVWATLGTEAAAVAAATATATAPAPVAAATTPTVLPATTTVAAPAPPSLAPPPPPVPAPLSAPPPPPIPAPALETVAAAVAPLAPTPPAASVLAARAKRRALLVRCLPVGIVLVGLLTAVARDALFREPLDEAIPEIDYAHPVLDLRFHDAVLPGDFVAATTMRFGLGVPDPKDPGKFKTKLIYDESGRTCNVCVRIDKTNEFMLGLERGAWKSPIRASLGRDRNGNRLIGAKSVWEHPGPPRVTIAQLVEIVPGGLSPDGKKRLLDTCLVRYDVTNEDAVPHTVGLRFLLDTFIGGNDAVPFTIAGARELCDTMKTFDRPEDVPDYISALERQDLQNPGTVAHLSLKYGAGLEPPSRVTLGAWPAHSLRTIAGGELAKAQDTRWEVPVLPMELAKSAGSPQGDSAVTMYWNDKEIAPRKTRTVGFAYGLGSVTGDKGAGQLGVTAGGEMMAGKEFTLTAYVKNPAPGTTIALVLPRGLQLAGGKDKEEVPMVAPGSPSPYSPVTWRVKALKSGAPRVRVTLSTGAKLEHRLVIKKAGIFE